MYRWATLQCTDELHYNVQMSYTTMYRWAKLQCTDELHYNVQMS